MYPVYKIKVRGDSSGRFTIDRRETWLISKNQTFDLRKDAENYVKNKTRNSGEFLNYTRSTKKEDFKNYLNKFLKEDKYLTDRRWFVDCPPIEKIKDGLKNDGIFIVLT